MAFPSHIWKQVKNISKGEFLSALVRDHWVPEPHKGGSEHVFIKELEGGVKLRVAIHYHSGSETFGPGLLKELLVSSQWTVADLKRLKLAK
jgi:hypothetical protein